MSFKNIPQLVNICLANCDNIIQMLKKMRVSTILILCMVFTFLTATIVFVKMSLALYTVANWKKENILCYYIFTNKLHNSVYIQLRFMAGLPLQWQKHTDDQDCISLTNNN